MSDTTHRRTALPTHPAARLLLAGLAGTVVFEIIALGLAPLLLGQPILPAMLVGALMSALTGTAPPAAVGWAGHLLAGLVVFPLGYVLLRRVTGITGWIAAGALWAVVLWLMAQAVFAPLAGGPVMSGFSVFALVSLVVHLIYALTVAAVWAMLPARGREAK